MAKPRESGPTRNPLLRSIRSSYDPYHSSPAYSTRQQERSRTSTLSNLNIPVEKERNSNPYSSPLLFGDDSIRTKADEMKRENERLRQEVHLLMRARPSSSTARTATSSSSGSSFSVPVTVTQSAQQESRRRDSRADRAFNIQGYTSSVPRIKLPPATHTVSIAKSLLPTTFSSIVKEEREESKPRFKTFSIKEATRRTRCGAPAERRMTVEKRRYEKEKNKIEVIRLPPPSRERSRNDYSVPSVLVLPANFHVVEQQARAIASQSIPASLKEEVLTTVWSRDVKAISEKLHPFEIPRKKPLPDPVDKEEEEEQLVPLPLSPSGMKRSGSPDLDRTRAFKVVRQRMVPFPETLPYGKGTAVSTIEQRRKRVSIQRHPEKQLFSIGPLDRTATSTPSLLSSAPGPLTPLDEAPRETVFLKPAPTHRSRGQRLHGSFPDHVSLSSSSDHPGIMRKGPPIGSRTSAPYPDTSEATLRMNTLAPIRNLDALGRIVPLKVKEHHHDAFAILGKFSKLEIARNRLDSLVKPNNPIVPPCRASYDVPDIDIVAQNDWHTRLSAEPSSPGSTARPTESCSE
jgi:hypothetical protein